MTFKERDMGWLAFAGWLMAKSLVRVDRLSLVGSDSRGLVETKPVNYN